MLRRNMLYRLPDRALNRRISGKVRTENRHVVAIMGNIVTGISDSAR